MTDCGSRVQRVLTKTTSNSLPRFTRTHTETRLTEEMSVGCGWTDVAKNTMPAMAKLAREIEKSTPDVIDYSLFPTP